MSREYHGIVGELEEFCFNAVDKLLMVAAGQVCAAYRSAEKHIAYNSDIRFLAIEYDTALRVTRTCSTSIL